MVKVNGFDEFNPDINIQVHNSRHSTKKKKKKEGKCCKWEK